jgi:long-chain fatty acid transport protein
MGTAFVAVADDPSALAYNPAGITQLKGTNIYGGPTFVAPSTTFKSPSGAEEKTEFQVFFPPHFYATSDIGTDDFRVGLGMFAPFGVGGRKWDEHGLTRFISTESMIGTLWINPTVAYQVLPKLSIGIGIDYMISQNKAKRKVDQSALGAGEGELKLKALGDGWGYNAGLLFKPDAKISLGFAYRSRIRVDHSGRIKFKNIAPALQPAFGAPEFSTDIETTLTFPDIVSFGAAYRPTKELTFSFDLEQIRWSTFKKATLDLEHEVPAAGFTDNSTPLDWRDIWTIKFGAEYRVNERFALRGGYVYVQTPVPNHTIDPSNPDSTQHNISVGFGYTKNRIVFDFFYMAGFYTTRTVENQILSGKYDNFIHYVGFSFGQRF